jgi:hypothetical protein
VYGGIQGQSAAHHDAETQISSLALQPREAHPNYSINGYVFFPKGEYTSIQMTLLNEETHQTQSRTSIWQDGETTTSIGNSVPLNPGTQAVAPVALPPTGVYRSEDQPQIQTE